MIASSKFSNTGPDGRWDAPSLPIGRDFVVAASAREPDGSDCFGGRSGPPQVGENGLRMEIFDNQAIDLAAINNAATVFGGIVAQGGDIPGSGSANVDICLSDEALSVVPRTCGPPPLPPVLPPVPPTTVPPTDVPPPSTPPTVTPARAMNDALVWPFRSRFQRSLRIGDAFIYRLTDGSGNVSYAIVAIDRILVQRFGRFRIPVLANDIAAAGLTPVVVFGPWHGRLIPLWDGSFMYVRNPTGRRR